MTGDSRRWAIAFVLLVIGSVALVALGVGGIVAGLITGVVVGVLVFRLQVFG